MSVWRRAARVARSNLNDLADRAASFGRGRSLENMSDDELEAELERRRLEQKTRAAVERAKAKGGDGGDERGGAEASDLPPDVAGPEFLANLSPKRRREVRQFYANLELPFGATRDEVKRSYRRLMRQYHPDKFPSDPARKQLATKLSQKLTRAYNDLNRLLRETEKK